MVTISGLANASLRAPRSSRAVSAPTGQWVMHCPHREQSTSLNFLLSFTPIVVRYPEPLRSQTFRLCTLSQIWMQRMHFTHLVASLIRGSRLSQRNTSAIFLYSLLNIPRSLAMDWRLQLPLRMQLVQLELWSDRISSTLIFRFRLTRGLFVRISIPS